MIEARFRLQLPTDLWITEVSTSFPDATFRLLTGVPIGDTALELGEITASDPEAAGEAVQDHPDVVAYDRLYLDDQRTIAQYEATEQQLYAFLGDSSLPPEFPVTVQNGAMEFDVTATRDHFEMLGAGLDATGYEYELLSVVEGRDPDALLTDRQRECVTVALREGYFEVPRSCTLEDVADRIGVDKSTASETIRRGAAEILEWFLVGRRPHPA
ncbi:helix-turn-helix domain-containing protein [Halobacteria archaeon AArc-dxtr1]|nr:helix-turn-helix domain-containing protein [Halobacteria archaeon AArc-dxtr1]